MSAQIKGTLAALLVAAAVAAPSSAHAKGGKDGDPKHEAGEQSRGGGAETRGEGKKHREDRHAQLVQHQPDYASRPSVVFEARGNREGKRAKRERHAPVQDFAVADRAQKRHSARIARWNDDRPSKVGKRQRSEARPFLDQQDAVRSRFAREDDLRPKLHRNVEKRIAKQARAANRAEEKRERRWVKQERRVLKQAAKVAPVLVYDRSSADLGRVVRYDEAPLYLAPEARPYRTYASAYGYSPRYPTNDAYSYGRSYYPLGYSALPAYSPYDLRYGYGDVGYGDVGYGDAGLAGLFGGGGGGLGDILVTLLPLLFGETLGLGGFATDPLGAGLLGGYATPDLAGGYEPYYQPALDHWAPVYSRPYQDAYPDDGMGEGQALLGGDSLMSLVELALASGLLGGELGGLGGLGGLLGLGGGLGFDSGLGLADPVHAYADPYSAPGGLLAGWGV